MNLAEQSIKLNIKNELLIDFFLKPEMAGKMMGGFIGLLILLGPLRDNIVIE